jgi:cbb3-type cytochrome oxidase maturation protein
MLNASRALGRPSSWKALTGWLFWRALQSGQFDDLKRPAHDILADDDRPHSNRRST